ncbi:hypothetical protein V1478_002489 [Vespula squamosa]|uniref:Uncharacterized protein n=1 Tax=Vespula squamosa TaxID=30214 RepID=A0ABD2BT95_VESSQ
MVGFNLAEADAGGGVGGDASSSSSSSLASPSSSSLAAGAQPLSLGLTGPSSSTQSPSSPWRSVPGPEPSTPSSPAERITNSLFDYLDKFLSLKSSISRFHRLQPSVTETPLETVKRESTNLTESGDSGPQTRTISFPCFFPRY